ncbi:putative permease MJ0326 [Waddlia chondrophila 2032/99]|uniref:Xanthine/uracil/vitamin C permease n=2 Tax=Waddlia chondrophila TaxID=71667 RepID=D6YVK5_WADCW|nr:NCS2 family permease [Waddlia chondrophila]ADI38166.1 Xanthine/uracil/vitamin C permease [Waddlia chondrophila WSU 86-1044]CCB91141.1 putative permease MJ0326 [Waddlia chondrophila 2032/99]
MRSFLERTFHLEKNQTSIKTEILAGFTTFSTMIYIIFVNPRILSEAGMDNGAVMTATIIATFFASFYMGLRANLPFALAPGMGLNAYFTYGIVIGEGYSWETALGACFLAGIIFLILNQAGIREAIMNSIPADLRLGTAGGIGLFLAFIGFKSINLVVPDEKTLLTLGNIKDPQIILAGTGVIMITVLMTLNVRGAIFICALFNWGIGLFLGLVEWKGLFSLPPTPLPTFMKLDILGALDLQILPVVLSLVFVAIFDTAGTLLGLASHGNFLTPEGRIPRTHQALNADAFGTIAGSIFGTAPFTTYLESATGISAGGRTGLTAVTVAFLFLTALFIAPLASSIPPFATAPALIVIGALMVKQTRLLDWEDMTEFVPGFITLIAIPMTFSIPTGVALGFVAFPSIKLLTGKVRETNWIVWVIALLFCTKFLFP